jgi:hypothetical protein
MLGTYGGANFDINPSCHDVNFERLVLGEYTPLNFLMDVHISEMLVSGVSELQKSTHPCRFLLLRILFVSAWIFLTSR